MISFHALKHEVNWVNDNETFECFSVSFFLVTILPFDEQLDLPFLQLQAPVIWLQ